MKEKNNLGSNLNIINKILKISSSKLRKYYLFFFLLSIFNAIIEIAAISSILPLLDILINKSNFFIDKINVITKNYIGLDVTNLRNIIYLLVIIFIIKFIFNLFSVFFYQKIIYELRVHLSNLTLSNYIFQEFSFFINNNSSRLIRNISLEIPKIIFGVISMLLSLVNEGVMIIFILSLLMFVNFESSIFIFLILIFFGSIFLLLSKKKINKLGAERLKADGLVVKSIKEIFENIKLMKILQKEKTFLKIFDKFNSTSAKSHMFYNFFAQSPRLFYEFILIVVLLIFCIFYSSNQEKIIYVLAIFAASAVRLIPSLSKFLSALQNIRFDSQSLNELYKDIKLNPSKIKENRKNISFNEKIRFENVSFKYPSSERMILKDINLEIKKNEFIGIFGLSGSGKSTFFDLISGLIHPVEGKILIDNFQLNETNLYDWQNKIGYMMQDTILMDASVIENIAFGEDIGKFSSEKIKESIEKSQLKNLINNLKNKENTILGERGLKLSGGERQRIALARTFYFNSEILLLDEITNSLDVHNEDIILNTIKNIKNKTKIFITHNLNSLKFCDQIFQVKDGKIEIYKK